MPNFLGHSQIYDSGVVALAGGAATVNLTKVAHAYRHWFVGIEYYDDVAGLPGDHVNPTTGTETFTVETHMKPIDFQAFTNNVLNSDSGQQANFNADAENIRCVLAGVDVATHVRMRAIGYTS